MLEWLFTSNNDYMGEKCIWSKIISQKNKNWIVFWLTYNEDSRKKQKISLKDQLLRRQCSVQFQSLKFNTLSTIWYHDECSVSKKPLKNGQELLLTPHHRSLVRSVKWIFKVILICLNILCFISYHGSFPLLRCEWWIIKNSNDRKRIRSVNHWEFPKQFDYLVSEYRSFFNSSIHLCSYNYNTRAYAQ